MRRDRTGEPIDDEDQDQTTADADTDTEPTMTADQAKAHIRRILNTDQRSGAT